jgi:hypothetical protein
MNYLLSAAIFTLSVVICFVAETPSLSWRLSLFSDFELLSSLDSSETDTLGVISSDFSSVFASSSELSTASFPSPVSPSYKEESQVSAIPLFFSLSLPSSLVGSLLACISLSPVSEIVEAEILALTPDDSLIVTRKTCSTIISYIDCT